MSISSPGWSLQPGVDFYSRLEVQTGSKSKHLVPVCSSNRDKRSPAVKTCHSSRWAWTFSPGWSYQSGLKVSLVLGAKNTGTKAKFRSGSKVVSLLVSVRHRQIKIVQGFIKAKGTTGILTFAECFYVCRVYFLGHSTNK